MALKPKHSKVLNNYLKGMNKKDAMLAAGYSESMATTKVNSVFGREDFQVELARRQALSAHRNDITLDWIVQRLAKIADANIADMLDDAGNVDISKMTPELRAAITGWTVDEIKSGRGKNAADIKRTRVIQADKLRALELLVRHLGLSKEKFTAEITGEVSLVERMYKARRRAGLEGGTSSDDQ